jgi:hypothetical protein
VNSNNTIMTPNQWKTLFLEARNLRKPTGGKLYSYQITENEFRILQKTLVESSIDELMWDMCFVMFASEWWKRNYDGSHWTWDGIMSAIQKHNGIDAPRRGRIVEAGLKKWGKLVYVHNQERQYIVSVALESGIPSKVLQNQTNYLTSTITDVYEALAKYTLSDESNLEKINLLAQKNGVPETLKTDLLYEIIEQVVEGLAILLHEYPKPENSESTLLQHWERNVENWAAYLQPIRIDEIARAFLALLLNEVEKLPVIDYKTRLIRTLTLSNGSAEINTHLEIPKGLIPYSSLGIGDGMAAGFPSRMKLMVLESGKQAKEIGTVIKDLNGNGLEFFPMGEIDSNKIGSIALGNKTVDRDVSLLLSHTSLTDTIPIPLLNADALDPTLPWIFGASDQDVWRLTNIGSAKLTSHQAISVVPKSLEIEGEIGSRWPFSMTQDIVEINGTCKLTSDSESYQIILRSLKFDDYSYQLESGESRRIQYYPKENAKVLIGFPRLYRVENSTLRKTRVSFDSLEIRQNGQWKKPVGNEVGVMDIRCLGEENEILFRNKTRVLPSKFSLTIGDRKILLKGIDDFKISINSDAKLGESYIEQSEGIIYLRTKENKPPEYVDLCLISPNDSQIEIRIPFPETRPRVFDPHDNELQPDQSLLLSRLHGYRIVTSNLLQIGVSATLVIALETFGGENLPSKSFYLRIGPLGQLVKPLNDFRDTIEELLACTHHIDAKATFRINGILIASIQRFSNDLNLHFEGEIAKLASYNLAPDYLSSLGFHALRLDTPFKREEIITLAWDESQGGWLLPSQTHQQSIEQTGKWMVYPTADCEAFIRPGVWIAAHPREIHYGNRFGIGAYKDSQFDRVEYFKEIFAALANDFNDPLWLELHLMYQETKHLPLSTFDVWTGLSKCHKALALAYFFFDSNFLYELEHQFLINWYSISVEDWSNAGDHYQAYLEKHQIGEMNIIANKLDYIDMTTIRALLQRQKLDLINLSLLTIVVQQQVNGTEVCSGLRPRKASEKNWPTQLATDVIRWFNILDPSIRSTMVEHLNDWEKPVAYLPYVLACHSVKPKLFDLDDLDAKQRFVLKQMVDFDKDYFVQIFNLVQGFQWTQIQKL